MGLDRRLVRLQGARGWSQHLRLFLTTGILGGFTTFSAFSLDAVLLWERGEAGLAAAYVLAPSCSRWRRCSAGLALDAGPVMRTGGKGSGGKGSAARAGQGGQQGSGAAGARRPAAGGRRAQGQAPEP